MKINSALAATPVIKPAVFISLGSPGIKYFPPDIEPPHLTPSSLSPSNCFPPSCAVCQLKWLPPSLAPSVAFSYSHLHVHALAVRPVGWWDWSTMPCFIICQSEGWLPHAMGTHVGVVLAVTHARRVHARKQNTHRACASPPDFDTLQTYMHTYTLETWLKGIENPKIIMESAPCGSWCGWICIFLLDEACVYSGILA